LDVVAASYIILYIVQVLYICEDR